MRFWICCLGLSISLCLTARVDAHTLDFDRSLASFDRQTCEGAYADYDQAAVGAVMLLPTRSFLVALRPGESLSDITWSAFTGDVLAVLPPEVSTVDIPTGDQKEYADLGQAPNPRHLGVNAAEVVGCRDIRGVRYAELLLFPMTIAENDQVVFNSALDIKVGDRRLGKNELQTVNQVGDDKDRQTLPMHAAADGDTRYIIVTAEPLLTPMTKFARYKTSIGLKAEVFLIDDIVADYAGCDDAERLREFLKDRYAQGAEYVLLAGDETRLPIRYAVDGSVASDPGVELEQICDLYFADLTGDWEVDGDGVWGEPGVDDPDIYPELRVGRLPFSTAAQAQAWVDKMIAYETNPGDGDTDYLLHVFFFCSDQMRDYSNGGQHGRLARSFSPQFIIDTAAGVEQDSGDDASPHSLAAPALIDTLATGYGIVNVLSHGTCVNFEVRTAGYNNFPKSRMRTVNTDDSSAAVSDLVHNGRTSFYYSMACDNGAFDKDQPPFNIHDPNLVQAFLALPEGGAVAFVANSRWGWVGSSHLLQKAFYDSLVANPDRPTIDAMYASKIRYSYYRDLVYGQNFYGDPSLKVYQQTPSLMSLEVEGNPASLIVTTTGESSPLPMCRILVSDSIEIVAEGVTDAAGKLEIDYGFGLGCEYTVAALKDGYAIARASFVPSIASGVDEDQTDAIPRNWALHQNYPNPFNPTTAIAFDLPRREHVILTVHNVLGQEVATLLDQEMPAGHHETTWAGTDDVSHQVASGVYFYRLATDNHADCKKMILLR